MAHNEIRLAVNPFLMEFVGREAELQEGGKSFRAKISRVDIVPGTISNQVEGKKHTYKDTEYAYVYALHPEDDTREVLLTSLPYDTHDPIRVDPEHVARLYIPRVGELTIFPGEESKVNYHTEEA